MFNDRLRLKLGIRRRIILLFSAFVVSVFLPSVILSQTWLASFFKKFQQAALETRYHSVFSSLEAKKSFLEAAVVDYAHCQTTMDYFFPVGLGTAKSYIDSLKEKGGLDFIAAVDSEYKIIGADADVFRGLAGDFSRGPLSGWIKENAVSAGFWHGRDGRLWLLASAPVTDPDGPAKKIGALFLGMWIDNKFIDGLSRTLDVSVESFHVLPSLAAAEDPLTDLPVQGLNWRVLADSGRPFLFGQAGPQNHAVYHLDFLLKDAAGQAAAVLRIKNPAQDALGAGPVISVFLWIIPLVLVPVLFLIVLVLTRHIVLPLVKLKTAVQEIGASHDLSRRLEIKSEEEVGGLVFEFNKMLEELEKLNKKTARTSEERAVLYEDLLHQKKFTSEIFATAPSIILVLLPDAKVKFVNKAIEDISGYKLEDVIGKNWFDYFLPFAARSQAKAVFEGMLAAGDQTRKQEESAILTKEGLERVALWNYCVLKDKEGRPVSVVAIGQDITEHKRIELELAKKMNDLERFYKVAMGREKVVIQLKKEIAELKSRAQNA